ncbi:MAG: cupin domain-containing protein [bacterium]
MSKNFIEESDFAELVQMEGIVTRIVTGLSGEKVMMVLTTIQPGYEIPSHAHPHEQMGLVQSGQCEMTIGDETRIVRKGDFCYFPSNMTHSGKTIGDEPFVMLDIFYPVREDFIKKVRGT